MLHILRVQLQWLTQKYNIQSRIFTSDFYIFPKFYFILIKFSIFKWSIIFDPKFNTSFYENCRFVVLYYKVPSTILIIEESVDASSHAIYLSIYRFK